MNLALVEQQTKILVDQGMRLFQIHRFAASDRAHIERLLGWADLKGRVVDLGCGVGEMALVAQEISDLQFVLVNISEFQLSQAPDVEKIRCDFHAVPLPDQSFDAALFCFSIGHGDPVRALNEAYRLLKHGGVLFIYDMVRLSGDNELMSAVEYRVNSREEMERAAVGFSLDFYMEPFDSGDFGRATLGDDFERIFGGTKPAIWRFIKW